jgi:hypothetical protein
MTEPSTAGVHALAETIAREIAARQSSGVVDLDAAGGLNGSFTLAIKYKTSLYSLTVTIPTGTGGEYVFALTETSDGGQANPIASFKYKDGSNWAVAVGLPAPITFGDVTLQTLSLALGQGTVT